MLIKVFKNAIDYIEGKPHAPSLSRRDFLAETTKFSGILLSAPIWASIFKTDRVLADAISDAAKVSPWSFSTHELGGGCGLTNIFAVTLKGGELYAGVDTRSLGIRSQMTFRTNVIKGLALNTSDSYYKTLMSGGGYDLIVNGGRSTQQPFMAPALAAQLLSKTAGFRIPCPKNDDYTDNMVNPLGWVNQLRLGSLMATVGAENRLRSRRIDGGRVMSIVSGRTVANLQNALRLQNPVLGTEEMGRIVAESATELSGIQSASHAGRVGTGDLMRNIASASQTAPRKFDASLGARALDPMHPTSAPAVGGVLNYANLSEREKVIFASHLANARGIAGSCYVLNGGYDYHNDLRDVAEVKHAQMARTDLLWLAAQHVANKPGVLYQYTDGGISWSNEASPRALGDRSVSSMGIFMIYDPAGVARYSPHDVGHFLPTLANGGEAADRSVFAARDARYEGISALVNWAKLSGSNTIDPRVVRALTKGIVRSDADYDSLFGV
jgi:hypothetical protein